MRNPGAYVQFVQVTEILVDDVTSYGEIAVEHPAAPHSSSTQSGTERIFDGLAILDLSESSNPKLARRAVDLFLQIPTARPLLGDLREQFRQDRFGDGAPRIFVRFVENITAVDGDAEGYFHPPWKDHPEYIIKVKDITQTTGWGWWPGVDRLKLPDRYYIDYKNFTTEARMAGILFHELLHVYAVYTYNGMRPDHIYKTGHGDARKGEIDDERFLKKLKNFYAALEAR